MQTAPHGQAVHGRRKDPHKAFLSLKKKLKQVAPPAGWGVSAPRVAHTEALALRPWAGTHTCPQRGVGSTSQSASLPWETDCHSRVVPRSESRRYCHCTGVGRGAGAWPVPIVRPTRPSRDTLTAHPGLGMRASCLLSNPLPPNRPGALSLRCTPCTMVEPACGSSWCTCPPTAFSPCVRVGSMTQRPQVPQVVRHGVGC